jgi:hypothetical protein
MKSSPKSLSVLKHYVKITAILLTLQVHAFVFAEMAFLRKPIVRSKNSNLCLSKGMNLIIGV